MSKALSEMSIEELWELFPIYLTRHQNEWSEWYAQEKERIADFLPMITAIKINHIGSTAILNIWAKPIIDILIEIPKTVAMQDLKDVIVHNGYICMSEAPNRISFNRGYTSHGFAERVYHLHLRYQGDHDELYFRDYMNEHPLLAKQYEELKLSLWKKYEHNRDAYTNAKGEFVTEHTKNAKMEYTNRYEQ